jgi:hypothetical protein
MDEFSCSIKILDAEYKPAILEEVTKTCKNLSSGGKHQLLQVLQKDEHHFDGTSGEFNMAPISLNLIGRDLNQYMLVPILFLDQWSSIRARKLQD